MVGEAWAGGSETEPRQSHHPVTPTHANPLSSAAAGAAGLPPSLCCAMRVEGAARGRLSAGFGPAPGCPTLARLNLATQPGATTCASSLFPAAVTWSSGAWKVIHLPLAASLGHAAWLRAFPRVLTLTHPPPFLPTHAQPFAPPTPNTGYQPLQTRREAGVKQQPDEVGKAAAAASTRRAPAVAAGRVSKPKRGAPKR